MATVNFATGYQQGLQQRYIANGLLYSSRLWNSPSNTIIQWRGHKVVRLPKLAILAGRKDRQRRTITDVNANYENQWEDYELTNERYWSSLVDPSDIDESNWTTTIANITRVFNDEEKIPEKDKQMFSTLFARKQALGGGEGIHEELLDEENFLRIFDGLITDMMEKGVPVTQLTMYVTPPVRTIIKNLQQFGRSLNVQQNNREINRIINLLDEVEIEPAVPSDRMRTMYDFTVGAEQVAGSQQIQMMLIHIPCMAAPEKYSFVGLDDPSAANSGNWLYYEQSYDDVIVFEQRHEGLAFVVAP